jgi:hypothetical protein
MEVNSILKQGIDKYTALFNDEFNNNIFVVVPVLGCGAA